MSVAEAGKDYEKILRDLDEGGAVIGDVYQSLMAKEDARIGLINRVVDHRSQKADYDSVLLNKPVPELLSLIAATWIKIIHEMPGFKNAADIRTSLYEGDRKVFTGFFFVAVAIVLFFIDISD
jgi:hypothetical protein